MLDLDAAWQPAVLRAMGTRHQIVASGGWKTSEPRNRFTTPSDMNLITVPKIEAGASPREAVGDRLPHESW